MSNRNNQQNTRQQNKTKGGSQRRLALALLLVLILAAFWFFETENPAVSSLRGRFLGSQNTESVEDPGSSDTSGDKSGADNAGNQNGEENTSGNELVSDSSGDVAGLDPNALPEYNGSHYVTVNGNIPAFPEEVYTKAGLVSENGKWKTEGSKVGRIDSNKLVPYEFYGELDSLGRCTVAYGCLGEETMPASGVERGDISKIHPSGWARAQNWERCHLIAWALSDENANERNLVTGTHYLNHDGMRPLEEEVEHYIWNTGNHVLYMSKPIFSGKELVPRGVQMTVWSCEDQGKGMAFNVYCFNVTPGAEINYVNGVVTTQEQAGQEARLYVVNTRSGVFHYPSCDGAKSIYKKNRKEVTATRKELTDQGYIPCGYCEP